jgi:hypothetical protein
MIKLKARQKKWSELEVLRSNAKDLEDGMDRGCDGSLRENRNAGSTSQKMFALEKSVESRTCSAGNREERMWAERRLVVAFVASIE